MNQDIIAKFGPLFEPKAVAVLGASGKQGKVGRMWMDCFIKAGCENIYPVNLREDEILGIKAYPSLSEIPGPVDYAVILLPPKAVPEAIRECAEKGVKGVAINSASLGFFGEDAKNLEKELVQSAVKAGTRIIGPNCLGIYSPTGKLPYPLGASMAPGSIGIVSQSGSFADILTMIATQNGVTFSKAISCGNESDLNVIDFLEYLGEDPETKTVLAYLEGVKDGQRLNRVAREVSKKKPLVVWKVGRTEMGAKAAISHTGSLAGSQEVWKGILEGAGVINVKSLEEGLDVLYTFNSLSLPSGNRVAIVAGTGGLAVGTIDTCLELGLDAPSLTPAIREEIQKIIPPFGSSSENPVDLSIAAVVNPKMFAEVLKMLDRDDQIDMMIVISTGAGDAFTEAMIEVKGQIKKPFVATSVDPLDRFAQDHKTFLKNGLPLFPDPGRAARALARLSQYAEFRRSLK